MVHREFDGEVVSIRVGSKMIGDVRWWIMKRKATDECESMKLVTKTRRRRHLQMRRGTTELLGETSKAIEHRSRLILVAGCEFDCEWERGGGRAQLRGL